MIEENAYRWHFLFKSGKIVLERSDYMFTLFLDTHGEVITVGLYNGKDLFVKTKESHYSHAVYFTSMIKDILSENGFSFKDIKNIVSVNGPGSFTGLRIGLSVGKTLAYSLGIPIYLVSTLDAYLVSDDFVGKKICVIEDTKGYYIKGTDIGEKYVNDVSSFINYHKVLEVLDIPKVVDFALETEDVPCHLVRANYVKEIEVSK